MGKIIGILLILVIAVIFGFILNLIIDGIVILLKKLLKKIRLVMGIPYKDEHSNIVVAPEQEESSEQAEHSKHNSNEILQKILSKRKNMPSDIEVNDYEVKE